jgi:protein-disulfide isomerase
MKSQQRFVLMDPVTEIDHLLGPADARVTVVEYGDFECPNCKQAAPVVKLALSRFGHRIRFVFRHFPLEDVHPHALHAAEAAEAAGAEGKFWEMHDLLFDNQSHLKPNNLRAYVEQLELDLRRYDADMIDELYRQRIREHIDGGVRSGVHATPTFFVNGRICDVSFGVQHLMEGIEAAVRK